jgi:hypothetical protein
MLLCSLAQRLPSPQTGSPLRASRAVESESRRTTITAVFASAVFFFFEVFSLLISGTGNNIDGVSVLALEAARFAAVLDEKDDVQSQASPIAPIEGQMAPVDLGYSHNLVAVADAIAEHAVPPHEQVHPPRHEDQGQAQEQEVEHEDAVQEGESVVQEERESVVQEEGESVVQEEGESVSGQEPDADDDHATVLSDLPALSPHFASLASSLSQL